MNYVSDSAGITIPSDLSCGHYFGTLDHESLSLILSAIAIEKKNLNLHSDRCIPLHSHSFGFTLLLRSQA